MNAMLHVTAILMSKKCSLNLLQKMLVVNAGY